MKQAQIGLVLSLILLLAGCTVTEPLPTPAPTATEPATVVSATLAATNTPTAQPSATSALFSATITATPTATPLPTVTPLPTATQQPTAGPTIPPEILDPSLPPPTGRIYFLWDPNPIPEERGIGELPETNLYEAIPGVFSNDWHIESMIEMFGQPLMRPSPDSVNLAILHYDDTNGDDHVDIQGGSDAANIYSYHIPDGSVTQLTKGESNPLTFSWSPQSSVLTYPQRNQVFSVNVDNSLPESNFVAIFPDDVTKLVWSPQNEFLAVNRFLGNIEILNMETGEIRPAITETDYQSIILWSSNAKWVSVSGRFNQGLYLINIESLERVEIVDETVFSYPTWSPNEPSLAFTDGTTLSLLNTDPFEITTLASMDYLGSPSWSLDGNNIALSFFEGDQSGILLINPISREQQKLDLGMSVSHVIWSPDGEWLLFSSTLDDTSGLYMVHKDGGVPYLFLDTTGRMPPYDIYWLPEQ